eukprot:gene7967-9800_t
MPSTNKQHQQKEQDIDEDYNDNQSDITDQNDYSGFQLIPEDDLENDISQSDREGEEEYSGFQMYQKSKKDTDYLFGNDYDNNEISSTTTATTTTTTTTATETTETNIENFSEFTDFTSHSKQFHNLDDEFNNIFKNNENSTATTTTTTTTTNIDPSKYFSNDDDKENPFNQTEQQQKEKEYCERNEFGHLILSKDKLFPPDHVELIQECMKDIKIDYKPSWSGIINEDKWINALKNKIIKQQDN